MTDQEYNELTSTAEGTLLLGLTLALDHLEHSKTGLQAAILAGKELADENKKFRLLLAEAENALADYIPTIEKTGASLNYGHGVLAQIRACLKTTAPADPV